ncbi:hypothetical protein TrRE_jg386, partial [Triparma retinervis]
IRSKSNEITEGRRREPPLRCSLGPL